MIRDPDPDWGEIADDTLPTRQRLVEDARGLAAGADDRVRVHTGATVQQMHPDHGRVRVRIDSPHGPRSLVVDHLLGLTGYVGTPRCIGSCRSTSATPPPPR